MGGLTLAGAVIVAAPLTATAVDTCIVSDVRNSNGKVTFQIRYSNNLTGCSWIVPNGVTSLEAAVVGAGGAGGWGNQGGGGGGGEVLHNQNFVVVPGSSIPVSIGTGGAAATAQNRPGGNGTSTTFGDIIATGGGGGGGAGPYWLTANMSPVGGPGGSSGGNNVFGTVATLTASGRAVYGAVGNSTFQGWTSYAHRGGAGISNSVAYGSQVSYGAGAGGGGAYEAATDSTAVSNGSGGMLTTLGRSGAGIYLMGKCLAGGGEGIYRAASGSNTVAGTNFTTANPCKTPDGVVVPGTNSGAYHASDATQYPAADSGGGAAAGIIGGTINDARAGSNGVVLISYTVTTPTITSSDFTNVQRPIISGNGSNGDTINLSVGGATYTTTVANGAWAVNLNSATPASGALSMTINGANAVSVYSTDPYGGISSTTTQNLTIDTVAPITPTVPSSPSLTNVNNRDLPFTIEQGSSAQCFLSSVGSYTSCSSPFNTGVLPDGVQTFRVKSVDPAGNTSSIATYSWTIDTVAPAAPAISTSSLYQTTTNVTVNFSAEAGSTFTCKLDNAATTNCTSSSSMLLSGLTQGNHTFTVYAADTAGNVSNSVYSFIVDSLAPSAPVISNSSAYATTPNLSIAFTSENGSTNNCSLDGAAFASCSSPFLTGTLTEGTHNLRVTSTDLAGNTSSLALYTWTQDTIAPTAPGISTSAAYQTTSNVTVNFTTSSGTTTCQLDTNPATQCTSATTATYSSLTEGSHSITIRSADAAGNISSSTYNFVVDTLAPVAPSLLPTSELTNNPVGTFSFTSEEGSSSSCSIDTAVFESCSSPLTTGSLTDGLHTIRIRSTDAAGNVSLVTMRSWTIDTVAPSAANISSQGAYQASNDVTVDFLAESGNTYTCQLDDTTPVACSSENFHSYSNLAEGQHTVRVRVTDAAGNVSTSSYTFTVDTVAPLAPVKASDNSAPKARTSLTNAIFNFSTELNTSTQCKVRSADWVSCSSGFELNDLALGAHSFSVRSIDLAGNISPETQYVWEVVPPGPGLPSISFEDNVVSLSGATAGANGDSYEYKLVDSNDNILVPWGSTSSSFALRQSDGEYQLFARLVDDQNIIGGSVSQLITITNQPAPAVGSTPRLNVASTQGYSSESRLEVSIDWPQGTKNVRLFSTQNNNSGLGQLTSLTGNWTQLDNRRRTMWNFTPAGVPKVTATHTLTAEFLDAKNVVINSQSTSVIIDVQAPTLLSAVPIAITGDTLPIDVQAADEVGGSGLSEAIVSRAARLIGPANSPTFELFPVVDGKVIISNVTLGETFLVRVRDRVGNISTASFTVAALNRETLTVTPKVAGTAKVGQTLKFSAGTWPKTYKVTNQWLADGIVIRGATKATFKLTNDQAGKKISVAVTGTRDTYYPTLVSSPTSAVVTGGKLTAGSIKIGTAQVGRLITPKIGTWTGAPTLSYVWKRGSTVVGKTLTYTPTKLDSGKKLTLTVTGAKLGFTKLSKTITTSAVKP